MTLNFFGGTTKYVYIRGEKKRGREKGERAVYGA